MDQFLTYKKGNLGPVFNFTAYIYIYTYICNYCNTRKEKGRKKQESHNPLKQIKKDLGKTSTGGQLVVKNSRSFIVKIGQEKTHQN